MPTLPNDSCIEADKTGRIHAYVGPDATNLFRAKTLISALNLYDRSKMLMTRGATPTKLLKMAGGYSGKTYKLGEYALAAEDVRKWAVEMEGALPVEIK